MIEHELRRQAVTEMHLRKWPVLDAPTLVVQWVRTVEPEERDRERALLGAFVPGDMPRTPYAAGSFSEQVRFAWESHSEGSNLALFIDGASAEAFLDPGTAEAIAPAIEWGESFPGKVVRATRIWIAERDREALDLVPRIGFAADELITCHIGEFARLWSDFRIQDDAYGRLVVASNSTGPGDLSRLVQRLQELGNYRNRALMGLPLAKEFWPRLDDAENRLRDLIGRVSDPAVTDDALLEEISGLSIELGSIAAASSFRISATAAYAQLVDERLAELECRPIAGFPSLIDFTQRRFLPAVRTCLSLKARTDELSARANQFTSLLRARIETRIENQNGKLLQSMERSAARQVRLQELVEGLSIFALAYYAVGLLGYVMKGFGHDLPAGLAERSIAVFVPISILVTWMAIRQLKRRAFGDEA